MVLMSHYLGNVKMINWIIWWRSRLEKWLCSLAIIVVYSAVALSLQGCSALILSGAITAGGFAVADRRTLGTQIEDKAISLKAGEIVYKLASRNSHVNVTSYNRRILLTGKVHDITTKKFIEYKLNSIENVRAVINELIVGKVSNFSVRSNDIFITSKVIASLMSNKDMLGNIVKVVTDCSNVYMMGRVTEHEGMDAAAAAASTSGVQKVIKEFEYIAEK